MVATTMDSFFNGQIKIKQDRFGYRFSIDAVILAANARPRAGDKIVDLGTGCGIISLILAYRNPQINIYGVEVQKELAEIAKQNVKENDMGERIRILHKDMKALTQRMISGPADLVISNPPYRKSNSGRFNPNYQRAVARHEISVTLFDVVETSRRILPASGRFITIYSAERMPDVLLQMRSSRIEPKKLRAIHSKRHSPAKMIMVEGVMAGRPGIKISPPLIIYRENGRYTEEVQKMFLP